MFIQNETIKKKIPSDWFCPLTGELIYDPVSLPSGVIYERQNI